MSLIRSRFLVAEKIHTQIESRLVDKIGGPMDVTLR